MTKSLLNLKLTLLALSLALALTNCAHKRGANHDYREQDRAIAEPIIMAIDRYRRKQGAYPLDLGALAPKYLKKIPETPYSLKDDDYTLTFSHFGANGRTWIYSPRTGWNCPGCYPESEL